MRDSWKTIGPVDALTLNGLEETLMGGQSFAWSRCSDNEWIGVIAKSIVRLRWDKGRLFWQASGIEPMKEEALREYLWLDESYQDALNCLPWRSDPILKEAMDAFPGLRILRQPLDEVLLVFLLSSAKGIAQIRQLRDRVNRLLGEDLGNGMHSFPGWEKLRGLSETQARDLGMGYRAKYLVAVARFLENRPQWLDDLRKSSYQRARQRLMELPGVGPKVADCVLLFGAARIEAFPIDTWIAQSLIRQYGLARWSLERMGEFARIHFGEYGGLAQQFLFSFQRRVSGRRKST